MVSRDSPSAFAASWTEYASRSLCPGRGGWDMDPDDLSTGPEAWLGVRATTTHASSPGAMRTTVTVPSCRPIDPARAFIGRAEDEDVMTAKPSTLVMRWRVSPFHEPGEYRPRAQFPVPASPDWDLSHDRLALLRAMAEPAASKLVEFTSV
jgi:hypothetical protein